MKRARGKIDWIVDVIRRLHKRAPFVRLFEGE
jgi:hypothetical protein